MKIIVKVASGFQLVSKNEQSIQIYKTYYEASEANDEDTIAELESNTEEEYLENTPVEWEILK